MEMRIQRRLTAASYLEDGAIGYLFERTLENGVGT
jgi:hypothetical protein